MKPFQLGTVFDVPLWIHPAPMALCPLLAVPCAIRDPLAAVILLFVLIVSILAHELGHAFAARAAGLHVRAIHLCGWVGYCIHEDPGPRTRTRCRVLVAGPLVNILIAAVLYVPALLVPDRWHAASIIGAAATMNLAAGFGNLAPILPLDGGQILLALLESRWSERDAMLVTAGIGAFLAIPMICISTALLVAGFPLPVFALWGANWSALKQALLRDGTPGDRVGWLVADRPAVSDADRLMVAVLVEQSRRNAERRRSIARSLK